MTRSGSEMPTGPGGHGVPAAQAAPADGEKGPAGPGDNVPVPAAPQRSPADGEVVPGDGEVVPDDEVDRRWRRVLWTLPTGLYVVGTRAGDRRNLMTASWVTQVSTDPRQVGVGLEQGSVTLGLVRDGGVFALSMVVPEDRAVVRRFVRPVPAEEVEVGEDGQGTMRDVPVRVDVTGAPVLAGAAAWVDCRVTQIVDVGSHHWVVGSVVGAGFGPAGDGAAVLTMADTRMNYGG